MEEVVNLLHSTSEDRYGKILEEGLVSPAERNTVGDIVSGRVEKNSIYMFDPDSAADWITYDYLSRPCVECQVPKDKVYVVEWGNKTIEKRPIEELAELRPTYSEWEDGNEINAESLMFLYPHKIAPENITPYREPKEELIPGGEV